MFEQVLLNEPRGRKRRYFAVAVLGQLAVIGILLAIPLVTVEQLPLAELTSVLIAPPPPPPPPPPAPVAAARVARAVTTPTLRFDASKLTAPRIVPKTVPQIADLPPGPAVDTAPAGVPGGVAGGQVGGVVGGVLGGVIGSVPAVAPPPPPPPPPQLAAAPAAPQIVRIGGQVQAAKVISDPPPAYPVLAKDAHVQGAVKMDAVIGENGHIEDLHVTSGPPLLINAAVAAVKQWTYHPTILNGVPVKVSTQIVVTFTLG